MTIEIDRILAKILLTPADLKALGIPGSNSSWLRREARGAMPRRLRISQTQICWDREEIFNWLDELRAARAHQFYADDPEG